MLDRCDKYAYAVKDDISLPHEGILLVRLNKQEYGLHTHPEWLNKN